LTGDQWMGLVRHSCEWRLAVATKQPGGSRWLVHQNAVGRRYCAAK
jgi:hypothetical protein